MFVVLLQKQSEGDDLTQIGRKCVLCKTEEEAISTQKKLCSHIKKTWRRMKREICEESMYGHKSIFIDIEDSNGYTISYEIHIIEETKEYE